MVLELIFLSATCDICGADENPTDKLLKCGYGWEEKFCDNIICRDCQIKDEKKQPNNL